LIDNIFVQIVIGLAVIFALLSVFAEKRFKWLFRRKAFGSARWARPWDADRAGLGKAGGLFLGRLWWRDLYHAGEGHIITIGGAGGGKSTALVVPALLNLTQGSVVVTDPSGELAAITRRRRAEIGSVVLLNPFQSIFEQDTGLDLPDTGFNPFSTLDAESDTFVSDCANFARLLMVTDRRESGSYFQDEGAEFLGLMIASIVTMDDPDLHNLPFLFQVVRDASENILWRLEAIRIDGHPALKDDAVRFADMIQTAPQQWAGVAAKAALATKRYAPGTPLARHVEKNGFDLADLKRKRVTVYLLVPSSMLTLALPWMNLLIGLIGEAVAKPGAASPVSILIDEAPALGYLPDLRSAMAQYRKVGLRVWIFTQTAAALANDDRYGQTGFKELMGICSFKQFFSIREPDVARLISEECGQKTVLNVSSSGNDQNVNMGDVGQPLIRPEEVRGLRKFRQIIIADELQHPIKARLIPYFKRPSWAAMADPNPYRKSKE
jgi:type IV secretion system protein VirD4